MVDLNSIPHSYDDAVNLLAAWHGDDADEPVSIYLMPDKDEQTVKFVEVSTSFSDHDNVRPVSMGRSSDFPYPSSVILLSQTDWDMVQKGQKQLPEEWAADRLLRVWPKVNESLTSNEIIAI